MRATLTALLLFRRTRAAAGRGQTFRSFQRPRGAAKRHGRSGLGRCHSRRTGHGDAQRPESSPPRHRRTASGWSG